MWVKGHTGVVENEAADRKASIAAFRGRTPGPGHTSKYKTRIPDAHWQQAQTPHELNWDRKSVKGLV